MSVTSPLSPAQAHALAADVRALEGVANLHGGSFGEVALLFPRERVHGLRINAVGELEVHVTVDLDVLGTEVDLRAFSEKIREIATTATGLTTDVILADAVYGD